MIISKEELKNYYDNAPSDGFLWSEISTDGAKEMSDERLLGFISQLPLVQTSGFGLIAELCKRFNEK